MFPRTKRFLCVSVVLAICSFYGVDHVSGESSFTKGAVSPLARRGMGDYWNMASIGNIQIPGIAGMSQATEIANALYSNPDFAPIFKEMPNLLSELRTLDKEQITNMLFLFKLYMSLPPPLLRFFNAIVSKIKSIAPTVRDMANLNIAAALSSYVTSYTNPIKNIFSSLAAYIPKNYRRAPATGAPSWASIGKVVSEILIENIGVPPPLIPFNLLRQGLTRLTKAYLDGNLRMPNLPKLPKLPKVQWKSIGELMRRPPKPRIPRIRPNRNPKPSPVAPPEAK